MRRDRARELRLFSAESGRLIQTKDAYAEATLAAGAKLDKLENAYAELVRKHELTLKAANAVAQERDTLWERLEEELRGRREKRCDTLIRKGGSGR
jgi:hypothetical protein